MLLFLFRITPLFLAKYVSLFIGFLLFSILKRERLIILSQLRLAFPELEKWGLVSLGIKSYASLLYLVFESVRIQSYLSKIKYPGDLGKSESYPIEYEDSCGIKEVFDSKLGAVCLVSHTANFELMAAFFIRKGLDLTVVAREPNYETILTLVEEFRLSYQLQLIWRKELNNPKKLLSVVRGGGFLGALIDQDMDMEGIYAAFFGLRCSYPRGPVAMAIKLKKPIFIVFDARTSYRTHKIHIERLDWEHLKGIKSDKEIESYIVQRFSEDLEAHIRKYPDQWVWWHRRWRRVEGGVRQEPMSTEKYLEYLEEVIQSRT